MDKDQILEPESQYFDTNEFNFLDLEDIVEDTNSLGYSTKQTGKDLMSEEELAEAGEVEEEEEEVEESQDLDEIEEGEDESEEVEDEAEESQEPEEDEEVDFEGYEITLPSGETLVLSEVVTGYKNAKELQEQQAKITEMQTTFDDRASQIGKHLELAKLEADRVIEDYEDFDWPSYRKDDPVGYVENREFLDKYKARRAEIISAQEAVEKERADAEAAEFKVKAKEAGVILARDIPGWNNDLYQQLMVYAIDNGANAEEIANTVDPAIFKILHKAMQFEKGKQTVKAKVKRLGGSPSKVVKSAAKSTDAPSKLSASKRAIIKKMETGGLSETEHSNSFMYLED